MWFYTYIYHNLMNIIIVSYHSNSKWGEGETKKNIIVTAVIANEEKVKGKDYHSYCSDSMWEEGEMKKYQLSWWFQLRGLLFGRSSY